MNARTYLVLVWCLTVLGPVEGRDSKPLNKNSDFEHGPPEVWDSGVRSGYEVLLSGSTAGQNLIQLENGDEAFQGRQFVRMRLPETAKVNANDFVWIGQTLELKRKNRYRLSVRAKWANPQNKLDSAIVSLWARNPDQSYNGQDFWIRDGKDYQSLSFEFAPNVDGMIFCYVALLTHIDGNNDTTEILIDDFLVEKIGEIKADQDPRNGNLLKDPGFSHEGPGGGWRATANGERASKRYVNIDGDRKLQLNLPTNCGNHDWIGVYQTVKLYAGNTYTLSSEVDRLLPKDPNQFCIMNMYAYKPPGKTAEAWLGPVDYKFTDNSRHRHEVKFTPIETEDYQITFRVFGWGNDERAVQINLDDVSLVKSVD